MRALEKRYSKIDRIVAKAKFSYAVFFKEVLLALALGGALAAIWIFNDEIEKLIFKHDTAQYLTDANLRWALVGVVGVVLLAVVIEAVSLYCRECVLTEDKIVFREGVFSVHVTTIPLAEIRIAETQQSFIQRIFGIGTVIVVTDAVVPYAIRNIRSADRFTRRVMRQSREARAGAGMKLTLG